MITNHAGAALRRLPATLWLIAGVATVMITVGCSSNGTAAHDTAPGPPQSLPTSDQVQPDSPAPSSGWTLPTGEAGPTRSSAPSSAAALTTVGTITERQGNVTQTETYSVGRVHYAKDGLPPQDVLDACNFDDATTEQESIFIPGRVVVSYTGSSVPDALLIDGSSMVQSTDVAEPFYGFAAVKGPDGTWSCADDAGDGGGSANLTLNSGSSATVDFWILDQALSPTTPKLPKSVLDTFAFTDQLGGGSASTPTASLRAEGRYAANYDCSTKVLVGLYAKPPTQCP